MEQPVGDVNKSLYQVFKLILSALMFGVAALFFPNSYALGLLSATLGIVLWIDFSKFNQYKLGGWLCASFMVIKGLTTLGGAYVYPQMCKGRGWIICELENTLFSFGGVSFIATFWFVFSVILFYWTLSE